MRKFQKTTTAIETESDIVLNFDSKFPESTWNTRCTPRGKSRKYNDHFGNAISAINRTLTNRDNQSEIANRKVAVTVEELTKQSEIVTAEYLNANKRKTKVEPVRFAGWNGSTDIFKTTDHYSVLPAPTTEMEK